MSAKGRIRGNVRCSQCGWEGRRIRSPKTQHRCDFLCRQCGSRTVAFKGIMVNLTADMARRKKERYASEKLGVIPEPRSK